MELNLSLVSIIMFYGLIAYLVFVHRKKIEFHKIYFLYKTKVGINLLDKISKYKFWKYLGYFGVPVGFVGMAAIFLLLLFKVPKILTSSIAEKSVQLILPWTGSGSVGPFMLMPFWIFVISIAVIILVHEGAHGVIARAHKLALKSTGVGMFTIIPLAFVEPDEKKLESAPIMTQLSVFAAGPFANFCTGVLVIAISIFLLIPATINMFESTGLEVMDVMKGYPAEQAGIRAGDIILAFNGVETKTTEQFVEEIMKLKPGEEARILLQDREISVTTTSKPEMSDIAYVGVSFKPHLEPKSNTLMGGFLSKFMLFLINLFSWLALLNFGIALINLLPLGPVDGGRMVKTALNALIKNNQTARTLWALISVSSLALLLINIFGPMFINLT